MYKAYMYIYTHTLFNTKFKHLLIFWDDKFHNDTSTKSKSYIFGSYESFLKIKYEIYLYRSIFFKTSDLFLVTKRSVLKNITQSNKYGQSHG